jgi:hypothetical protein
MPKTSFGWVVGAKTRNVAHCAIYEPQKMEANIACLNSYGRVTTVRLAAPTDRRCKRCVARKLLPF